jgi:hypothetical protein
MAETGPGRFSVDWAAPGLGLYRLEQDDLTRVVAVGPQSPREFEQTLASAGPMQALVDASRGGILRLEEGAPDVRMVREGRPAAGRGWIGITPRGAYVTEDLTIAPVLPAWAWLILAAGLAVGAWLREGRRLALRAPQTSG